MRPDMGREVKGKDDLIIKKGDFIIEHKQGKLLTEFYKVDDQLLGEGTCFR
jgi:hypothetical protein